MLGSVRGGFHKKHTGTRSALWCVRGTRHQRIIFVLGWARCGFYEKCVVTRYAEHVFLHPVGYVGYVVHSGASERIMSNHYF
jgi:hypothetical protein